MLDLNWMGDKRNLHVGFPEASLGKYAKVLVDKGFKVVVVDQTGDDDKEQKKRRFQGREIVAILSKGLFTVGGADLSYESQWTVALKVKQSQGKYEFGLVMVDV